MQWAPDSTDWCLAIKRVTLSQTGVSSFGKPQEPPALRGRDRRRSTLDGRALGARDGYLWMTDSAGRLVVIGSA